MSVWSFFLIVTFLYAIGLFVTHKMTSERQVFWSGYALQTLNDEDEWVDSTRMQIGSKDSMQTIRFIINIDDAEHWRQPVSFVLGGPFSAQVFWDGEMIGSKGVIENDNEIVAGPIDSSMLAPEKLIVPGDHELTLLVSSQSLIFQDNSILHYVSLGPYRQDGTREIRYYTTPLLIFSGLLILSFQSFRIGRNAGNSLHISLGIYGFCISLALVSEISRAAINYSYDYHELRSFMSSLGIMGAGFTLVYTCYRMSISNLAKVALAAGLLIALVTSLLPMASEDIQLALVFILLVTAPSLFFLFQLTKKQISYLSTLPLFCIACIISFRLSIGLLLDNFIFVASLILIGGAWLWTYVEVRRQDDNLNIQNNLLHFNLKSGGNERIIPANECYALKAEGNFTSLMLLDGSTALHQDGLGGLLAQKPQNFVRVHRSFAVNLESVVSVKSTEGSRYWAHMKNQEKIPVSRYRVAELRALMKTDSE